MHRIIALVTVGTLVLAAVPATAALRTGTDDADRIVGTTGADVLRGLDGRDRLDGRGGDDRIDGGAKDDTSRGGAGRARAIVSAPTASTGCRKPRR